MLCKRFAGPRGAGSSALRLALCAGAAVSGLTAGAGGQISWLGGNGNWSDPAKWTGGNVPNTTSEIASIDAAGTYTVSHNSSYSILSLAIPTPTATLHILDGTSLALASNGTSIANNGLINVNDGGSGSGTYIQFQSSSTLSGSGSLVLRAHPANPNTAFLHYSGGGEVLTQSAGHTIRGSGRIYIQLDNYGTVDANVSGRVLQMFSQPKTNRALMRATGGGVLDLNTTVTQSGIGALISADGGQVRLTNATVHGGSLSAVNAGLIQIAAASAVNGVTVSGPMELADSVSLQFGGGLTNNGTITVNSVAGGSGTYMQATASQALRGTGAIVLNAHAANLDTAYLHYSGGGEVVTQEAGHTIRGTGRVYVSLANNGVLSADTNGRTLQLVSQPKTNNGIMQAVGGGILDINCTLTQTGGGRILANASPVLFRAATVVGGLITSTGAGGVGQVVTGSRFSGVTLGGPQEILNGTYLQIDAGLINNGVMTVNTVAGGSDTRIDVLASQTLSGSGQIVLNAHAANPDTARILYTGGGEVLTQAFPHVIRGAGNIYVNLVNNSTVNANQPGRTLSLVGQPKTNTGLFTATAGGVLNLASTITQTGTGARITADGGSVVFSSMTLNGGPVSTINGGTAAVAGTALFNGVTMSGALSVPNSTVLRLIGGLANSGTITVNPVAGGSDTRIDILASQTLSGSGEIVLNAHAANQDTARILYNGGGEVLTQSPSHTIRGSGNIHVNLVNQGLVKADRAGRVLNLLGFPKTNAGNIVATDGGILDISTSISQGPAGRITADGGTVRFYGGTTSGGRIEALGGGLSLVAASSRFGGVTISGPMEIANGSAAVLESGINNDGTITVNPIAGGSVTQIQILGSTTIDGTGRIVLNSHPSYFDSARLLYNGGGEVLTFGSEQTLAGRGYIYTITNHNGTIAPGTDSTPIGRLLFAGAGTLTLSATSVCDFQITNPGDANADQITSTLPIRLAGSFVVSTPGTYKGVAGDSWTVIQGSSVTGTFDQGVFLPPQDHGNAFRVLYYPNRVVVEVFCYADMNSDGGVDGADVQAFFAVWENGESIADVNGDGGVDGADVEAFFALWESGGC